MRRSCQCSSVSCPSPATPRQHSAFAQHVAHVQQRTHVQRSTHVAVAWLPATSASLTRRRKWLASGAPCLAGVDRRALEEKGRNRQELPGLDRPNDPRRLGYRRGLSHFSVPACTRCMQGRYRLDGQRLESERLESHRPNPSASGHQSAGTHLTRMAWARSSAITCVTTEPSK
jgi:hypothetical protein